MYDQEMIYECLFVKRLNRFVATVILDGKEVDVHVKNTGRCKELLLAGSTCYIIKSPNPKRKYLYDLVAIYKDNLLFSNVTKVKREVTYNKSRFDIYVERIDDNGILEKIFVEVKGVTLFDNGCASFPDAPTKRGAKHLAELIDCIKDGYKPYIIFLIQTEKVNSFTPNVDIDPNFTQEFKRAIASGVTVLAYNSYITPSEVVIKDPVEIII